MEEWHPLWGMEQWPSPGAPFHQTWRIFQTKPWRLLCFFLVKHAVSCVNQRPVIILSVVAGGMAAAQGEKKGNDRPGLPTSCPPLPAEERARECVSREVIVRTVKTVQNCRVTQDECLSVLFPQGEWDLGFVRGRVSNFFPASARHHMAMLITHSA